MAIFDKGKRSSGSPRDDAEAQRTAGEPKPAPLYPDSTGGEVRRREAAIIGPSIHIEGTLSGEEDLLIEGHVTGTVKLHGNNLTIGSKGKVRAELHAHTIFVDGIVEGDLYGSERVTIRKTAQIQGNITSPRVSLEDGARFKGTIEMDPDVVGAAMGTPTRRSTPAVTANGKDSTPRNVIAGGPVTPAVVPSGSTDVTAAGSASAGKGGVSD